MIYVYYYYYYYIIIIIIIIIIIHTVYIHILLCSICKSFVFFYLR